MCGIAGTISLDGAPVDPTVVHAMTSTIAHRGPDGHGYLLVGRDVQDLSGAIGMGSLPQVTDAVVGFGHRRLTVIDRTEGGAQPKVDGSGRYGLVFNGEIYNYREIRRDLTAKGVSLRTGSDTEVLLEGFALWGAQVLDRVKGMFAFAIWDAVEQSLFAARDRFGIKPFYWTKTDTHLVFASEIKALLVHPGVEARAETEAIADFLYHGNCDVGDRTMFRGVHSLGAGCYMRVSRGESEPLIRRYYDLRDRVAEAEPLNASGAVDRVRAALFDSVADHLISDVRVASCLSGGLDSSTVVAVAGELRRSRPGDAASLGETFQTFTSSYEDRTLDERRWALPAAAAAGAEPTLVFPTAEGFAAALDSMIWHMDAPLPSGSLYAQWEVMKAARERGVVVMLDGQGGDEVFAGYGKFRYAHLSHLLRRRRLLDFAREARALISQGDRYVLDIRNGYRYLPRPLRRALGVDGLLSGAVKVKADVGGVNDPSAHWWGAVREGADPIRAIQLDDILDDTLPQLLRYEDRSSMATAIEARVPFLDHEVVELGLTLPTALKIAEGYGKVAVREAMKGILPEPVRLRQSKLGFVAPDRAWIGTTLKRDFVEELSAAHLASPFVDLRALRDATLKDSGRASVQAYRGLLRVLTLERWMKIFKVSP